MRDRDREFSVFFAAEAERLRRLAFFLTGDVDRAGDLAQDALAATYRRWSKIHGEDPGPYARRALVNLCRNAKRRRFVERRYAASIREGSMSHEGRIEETLRIVEALRVLSPTQRAAVVLRYYEDLTETDIARVLDRPINTVKSDLSRALAKLRPLLEEQEVS
jgi:RNA polymerase sigma-70 factor (sigma-E family)